MSTGTSKKPNASGRNRNNRSALLQWMVIVVIVIFAVMAAIIFTDGSGLRVGQGGAPANTKTI